MSEAQQEKVREEAPDPVEQEPEPEAVEEEPAAEEAPEEDNDLAAETDVAKLRHEAASRRRQLRTVEAERDALRERVDTHDRAEVERLATGRLANPADAWLAIGSLDELRGADGVLDQARVEAGLGRIVQERPHWAAATRMPDLHQGARAPEREAPSFGQALKGGRR